MLVCYASSLPFAIKRPILSTKTFYVASCRNDLTLRWIIKGNQSIDRRKYKKLDINDKSEYMYDCDARVRC